MITTWEPDGSGELITVVIRSNTDWKIEADSWINILGPTSGTGDATITIEAPANPEIIRIGTIKIFTDSIVRFLTISQKQDDSAEKEEQRRRDREDVESAVAWLTWDMIRLENIVPVDVKTDLDFMTTGPHKTSIDWWSPDEDYVARNGVVNRPTWTQGEQQLTVIATITKGEALELVSFELTLPTLTQTDEEAVWSDMLSLTWDMIRLENLVQSDVRTNLNLITVGASGSIINWASSDPNRITIGGLVTRPNFQNGSINVYLHATITKGSVTEMVDFNLTVTKHDKVVEKCPICDEDLDEDGNCPNQHQHDEDAVRVAKAALTWNLIRNQNILQEEVMTDLSLVEGLNGTNISWSSTNETAVATNGTVTRPSSPDADVDITATITKGEVSDSVSFALKILKTVQKCSICDEDLDEDGNCPNQHQHDEDDVAADKDWLTWEIIRKLNTLQTDVTSDLDFVTVGPNGSVIDWDTDQTTYIGQDGSVTRRSYSEGNLDVHLHANITKGEALDTKGFDVVVTKLSPTDIESVNDDAFNWLTWDVIKKTNTEPYEVHSDLYFPLSGPNGTTITWRVDWTQLLCIANDGEIIDRPGPMDQGINNLPIATISKGSESQEVTFDLTVVAAELTDEQWVELIKNTITWNMIRGGNVVQTDVQTDLALAVPVGGGTKVTWFSPNSALISLTGIVTRPTYSVGDVSITIMATIARGAVSDTVSFDLTVTKLLQNPTESVQEDKLWLTWEIIRNLNDLPTNVLTDLDLVRGGPAGSDISWSSSNTAAIAISGTVNRLAGTNDARVAIIATLTRSSATDTVEFDLTVPKAPMIPQMPQQSGTLTWDGSSQTPTWLYYDTDQLTIGGTTSSINAAAYSATFTPKSGYQWSDGTIVGKPVGWQIIQSAGTLSLSSTSLTIGANETSKTITVTKSGDGAVSAVSSNTGIATVSVSGTTVTVTRHATGTGPVTITVSVAETLNSSAPTNGTCSVTVDPTDAQAVSTAHTDLVWNTIRKSNVLQTDVKTDLTLVTTGSAGTTISWASNTTARITTAGVVSRPAYSSGNATVTVTATIKKGSASQTKAFAITVTAADPKMTWTERAISTNLVGYWDVCLGGTTWVAVGLTGTGNRIASSTNGTTWTLRSMPDSSFFGSGVCYGNSMFVAVGSVNASGYNGQRCIITSSNGTTWVERYKSSSSNTGSFNRVAFGNGVFIATANGGQMSTERMMRSTNGTAWTDCAPSGNSQGWDDICYGKGLFVAVTASGGGSQRVLTSPDGLAWTQRNSADDTIAWGGICFSSTLGMFVAVPSGYSGAGVNKFMTSTDGINWTIREWEPATSGYCSYSSICWGGSGRFIAVARNSWRGDRKKAVTSTDGINWTPIETPWDSDSSQQITSIAASGSLFVAVTSNNGTGNKSITTPGTLS